MTTHIFNTVRFFVLECIQQLIQEGALPPTLETNKITTEPPKMANHGDISTNAAMILAGQLKQNPRAIATTLLPLLEKYPFVEKVEIAGAGFLNFFFKAEFWQQQLQAMLQQGESYWQNNLGQGAFVNVEYVSANPTGPLHIGHVRGAVFGDVLARLLQATGYIVTKEYYVNDAGAQVDVLARSLYLRYQEALTGEEITIPEGLYPGEYLKDAAQDLAKTEGSQWLQQEEAHWLPFFREKGIAAMLTLIKQDLAALGIQQDIFTSEKTLVETGKVWECFELLQEKSLLYQGVLAAPKGKTPDDWEERPQTLFKSSAFGDDTDRALQKSDGSWTYFASDAAYHLDKINRNFNILINVWGADHGGYVKRIAAVVAALSHGKVTLDVKLCQLVHLYKEGKPYKMSKRAGTFVTARDIIEEIGADAVRFMMLTRRNDVTFDFDIASVLEQSKDNPVFYVQYAHARCASVLRHAASLLPAKNLEPEALALADFHFLEDEAEIALLKILAGLPRQIEMASQKFEPHRLCFYVQEIAQHFHALWNKGKSDAELRFIETQNPAKTMARLALVTAVKFHIAGILELLGITPVEEMH